MLIAGFPAGPWGTNCYVVAAGRGEQCVVVDPGKDAILGIDEVVRENRLEPVAVLLTHGHIDHTWSVVPVCEARGVPAYVHPADQPMLTDPLSGLSAQTRAVMNEMTGGRLPAIEPDQILELGDGDVLELAGVSFVVDHAPGHTQGSVMFRTPGGQEEEPLCFSGDVLFEGSIGRTDLPGGDHSAMLRSLATKVLPLNDATVVLPGHGNQTTIARERRTNPYLRQVLANGPGYDVPDAARTGL